MADEKEGQKPEDETADDDSPEGDQDSAEDPNDAMMAEWEAMAADGEEGEEDAASAEADAAGSGALGGSAPAIHTVDLDAYAILGTTSMPVSQLLRMGRGAVVELDTGVGDTVEIKINDQLIARGEVVVVEDRIGVEITELVKREGS